MAARRHLSQVQPQAEVFGAGMRVSAVAADFAARALHRRFASPDSAGVAELACDAFDPGAGFRTSLRSMHRPHASRIFSSRSSAPPG